LISRNFDKNRRGQYVSGNILMPKVIASIIVGFQDTCHVIKSAPKGLRHDFFAALPGRIEELINEYPDLLGSLELYLHINKIRIEEGRLLWHGDVEALLKRVPVGTAEALTTNFEGTYDNDHIPAKALIKNKLKDYVEAGFDILYNFFDIGKQPADMTTNRAKYICLSKELMLSDCCLLFDIYIEQWKSQRRRERQADIAELHYNDAKRFNKQLKCVRGKFFEGKLLEGYFTVLTTFSQDGSHHAKHKKVLKDAVGLTQKNAIKLKEACDKEAAYFKEILPSTDKRDKTRKYTLMDFVNSELESFSDKGGICIRIPTWMHACSRTFRNSPVHKDVKKSVIEHVMSDIRRYIDGDAGETPPVPPVHLDFDIFLLLFKLYSENRKRFYSLPWEQPCEVLNGQTCDQYFNSLLGSRLTSDTTSRQLRLLNQSE